MLELIEQHRGELDESCRKYHAAISISCWKFLPAIPHRMFGGYFDLKFELEHVFGRKVDLVMSGAIRNRYFLEAVNRQRKLVYAA